MKYNFESLLDNVLHNRKIRKPNIIITLFLQKLFFKNIYLKLLDNNDKL